MNVSIIKTRRLLLEGQREKKAATLEEDLREKRTEMARRERWAALPNLEKDIPALLLSGHKYSSLPCALLPLHHTDEVNFGGLQ